MLEWTVVLLHDSNEQMECIVVKADTVYEAIRNACADTQDVESIIKVFAYVE